MICDAATGCCNEHHASCFVISLTDICHTFHKSYIFYFRQKHNKHQVSNNQSDCKHSYLHRLKLCLNLNSACNIRLQLHKCAINSINRIKLMAIQPFRVRPRRCVNLRQNSTEVIVCNYFTTKLYCLRCALPRARSNTDK